MPSSTYFSKRRSINCPKSAYRKLQVFQVEYGLPEFIFSPATLIRLGLKVWLLQHDSIEPLIGSRVINKQRVFLFREECDILKAQISHKPEMWLGGLTDFICNNPNLLKPYIAIEAKRNAIEPPIQTIQADWFG